MFPYVQTEFHGLVYVSAASRPVTGHHGEESGSVFFIPSHQVYKH